MQLGVIIYYSLEGLLPKDKTKFCRTFLGYNDKSQFGRYTYVRSGLLDDIPHVRIAPSLLIVDKEAQPKIENFVKDFDIDLFVRRVVLEKDDIRKLSRKLERDD